MSNHSITCHLSSLNINEGDNVVILPVSYSYISETTLCYSSNDSCQVFSLPLFGTCSEYGAIELTSGSEEICNILRTTINKDLMNNKENRDYKAKQKFNFSNNYFIFKRESYNEAATCEFSSDAQLFRQSKDQTQLLNIDNIDSNDELLMYLRNGSLIKVNSESPERITYIVIKKTVYDSLIKKKYKEKLKRVTNNITSILNTELPNDQKYHKIEVSKIDKALEFFNNESQLKIELSRTLELIAISYDLIKNKPNTINFIKHISHWAIIDDIYRNTGKSYYPNVRRHSNMKILHSLNEIILNEINKKREFNINYWSVENGYCTDEAKKSEWLD